MKHTEDKNIRFAGYGVDTLFVLFFLALEYGRSVQLFSMDGMLTATTMAFVLVLPYFLPSRFERPALSRWLAVRGSVMLAALMLGVAYGRNSGAAVPAGISTVPMTFLILASMVSCYIQFYGLMRLRPAK
jgi:hypothetical protein